jgi:uncharacterized heparinase superfamily protein
MLRCIRRRDYIGNGFTNPVCGGYRGSKSVDRGSIAIDIERLRVRSVVRKKMKLGRLIRTIRHLKFSQMVNRVLFRLRWYQIGRPVIEFRPASGRWLDPIAGSQTMTGPDRFSVLNRSIDIESAATWNDAAIEKLALYNLHYHDDLTAAGADDRVEWHERLIERWISENPVGRGNGWEPYTLSLRIVNWIKWHKRTDRLSDKAIKSLWVQARVLEQSLEYHLLGNHLLANAKALYFAGCFFEGRVADRWLLKATQLLTSQLDEQILSDGAHFELSPMYHSIILEDLLDVLNISRQVDVRVPQFVIDSIDPMRRWLSVMTHADGELSYFNDSVTGIAPTRAEIESYAISLGMHASVSVKGSDYLQASGYARLDTETMSLLVDIGEIGPAYQPGHGHCDCLSFEMSMDGRRTFVNRGISTYAVGNRRLSERSTSSHNTVSIAAAEQSEIWSGFRVGRRARPHSVKVSDRRVEASHDGWRRYGVLHRRTFNVDAADVEISDHLIATGQRDFPGTANFHFYPGISVTLNGSTALFDGGTIEFESSDDVRLESYQYCAGFGDTVNASVLRVSFSSNLITRISHEDPVSN